jgi:hypothetical protein
MLIVHCSALGSWNKQAGQATLAGSNLLEKQRKRAPRV